MFTLAAIWAVVQVSTAFVRSEPDYESPLLTELLMGAVVQTDSTDRYWKHVISTEPPYEGWVNALMLTPIGDDAALEAFNSTPKLVCTALHTTVHDSRGKVLRELCMGDTVSGTLRKGGRCTVTLPSGEQGSVRSEDMAPKGRTDGDIHHTAVLTALQMTGAPYLWGGNSPDGLDCSGLVWLSYLMAGISLPRDASQQALCGQEVKGALYESGYVNPAALREGDLIFFGTAGGNGAHITHVGLYLGQGRFIHSSQTVRISSLDPASPDFYSSKKVLAVRRL